MIIHVHNKVKVKLNNLCNGSNYSIGVWLHYKIFFPDVFVLIVSNIAAVIALIVIYSKHYSTSHKSHNF